MKLLLNGIVKNESARIERMLASVAPYICGYAIVDTGSTDDTIAKIHEFFRERGVPGVVSSAPFNDWSQARNAALDAARTWQSNVGYDYLLLVDADMELVVDDPHAFDNLTAESYSINQAAGTFVYANTRLVRRDSKAKYIGVTHEYFDNIGPLLTGVKFRDHADGANRPGKFKRDIKLLTRDLLRDPNNARSYFYLANSYRDAGEPAKAIASYTRRIALGGWDEEVWNAYYERAKCYKDMGKEAEYVAGMLEAYGHRPSRAEPLYDLAKFHRERGKNAAAVLFAHKAMSIPIPVDSLFVQTHAYVYGPREEFSIAAYYSPDAAEKREGFHVTNMLLLDRETPDHVRSQAGNNIYWYTEPLAKLCPSFTAKEINFQAPEGYAATNPSVSTTGTELWCAVRTVNYWMDQDGCYHIRGREGWFDDQNPIHTRTFLVHLNSDLNVNAASQEIHLPKDWPDPVFRSVRSWEDMRLNYIGDQFQISACVREANPEGWCEQYTAKFSNKWPAGYQLVDWRRLDPGWRQHEKNWAPVHGREGYMYRLGHMLNGDAGTVSKVIPKIFTDNMSGSSQLVPFNGGWLCVIHEARILPFKNKRYYTHRFAYLDHEFTLQRLSQPFVFHDREVEFCAGLAAHNDKLIVSYGRRDAEAWIGSIDRKELHDLLLGPANEQY